MKKAALILLSLVMLFSLVACGGKPAEPANTGTPGSATSDPTPNNGPSSNETSAPVGRETLSVAMTTDYGTLDAIGVSQNYFDVLVNVMEPLWDYGLDGTIRYRLAESAEFVEPDHMVVTLKKGVTFSNGNPFTASDVLFSMTLYRDAGTPYAPQKVQTTDFERTKIIDDYSFDWYLKSPTILQYTCAASMYIYDEESYDPEKQALNPIGTGPYVVTEYVVNSHTVIERRDDYWGELPQLKTITFHIIKETAQQMNSLETGLVDVTPISLADVEYAKNLPGVQVRARKGGYIYLGLNIAQDCKLADPLAREAICHAIDTQAISNVIYYGLAREMHNPFTTAVMDMEDRFENLGVYEKGYDLELAQKMAEEAGLVGETLVLANNGQAEFITASEMIQDMLAKIGVTVEIVSFDNASYIEVKNDKTKFDLNLSSGSVVNYVLGDYFVNGVAYNKVNGDAENWANGHGQRYQEIMRGSLNELDDAKRSDILYELMGYYIETNPTYGLVEFDTYYAFPDDLDFDQYFDTIMAPYFAWDFNFK